MTTRLPFGALPSSDGKAIQGTSSGTAKNLLFLLDFLHPVEMARAVLGLTWETKTTIIARFHALRGVRAVACTHAGGDYTNQTT